jgi:hypothetical protein
VLGTSAFTAHARRPCRAVSAYRSQYMTGFHADQGRHQSAARNRVHPESALRRLLSLHQCSARGQGTGLVRSSPCTWRVHCLNRCAMRWTSLSHPVRWAHATGASRLVDRTVVAGCFVPFTGRSDEYLVLQRPVWYGIAAFTGHGSVRMDIEVSEWLWQNRGRCLPMATPDGRLCASGELALRGCPPVDRMSRISCGLCMLPLQLRQQP